MGLLGQGGMGAVYRARDPEIDRTVALKVLSPLLLAGGELRQEYLERFRREARAAGRLSHPNIISVYDLGTDEATSTPFIVMEYVAGISLETVLRENPSMPLEQAVEILEQVAAALTEAHRNGVVHRDVKPANVFLDARGRVKVGDFGIARLEGSELTQSGVGLGTPGYSAPEVVRGAPADARSDVFALGVLAYRLLTGRRPFEAATRETMAIEILERSPAPPSSLRREIPAHVSAAVMRALAKDREARTPSAETFAAELRAATPGATAVPAPVVTPPPAAVAPTGTIAVPTIASAPRRRRRLIVILLGLAALAAAAFVALRGSSSAPPRPAETMPAARRETPPPRTAHPTPAPPIVRSARPVVVPAAPPGDVREPPREEPRRDDNQDQDKQGRGKHEGKGKKKGHGKGGKEH